MFRKQKQIWPHNELSGVPYFSGVPRKRGRSFGALAGMLARTAFLILENVFILLINKLPWHCGINSIANWKSCCRKDVDEHGIKKICFKQHNEIIRKTQKWKNKKELTTKPNWNEKMKNKVEQPINRNRNSLKENYSTRTVTRLFFNFSRIMIGISRSA